MIKQVILYITYSFKRGKILSKELWDNYPLFLKNKHTQVWGVRILTQSSTINYTKKLWQLLNESEASYTTHYTLSQEMWDNYHISWKQKNTHGGERMEY